jgi:NAD(P)-dependent dehydrogenase (short-subunit alcohol dehydrogenase family)
MRSVAQLMDLSDRVALVTGAAGHIGAALTDALAELGASIVVADLDEHACEAAAARLVAAHNVRCTAHAIDLQDTDAVRQLPTLVEETFGRLDVLVNCAALVGTAGRVGWSTRFGDQDVAVWRDALEINLTAPFVLVQACEELLSASGHGSVINIGSIYGVVGPDWRLYEGSPLGNPAAYGASKGGLLQLTRWLATTLAPRIRVNAISPGGVFRGTPEPFLSRYIARTPLARMATEEDFKGAVAYLASDLSAYVTGQNLLVDGGWVTW